MNSARPFGADPVSLACLPDATELTTWIDGSKFMVKVVGTAESVIEIGQQFAWLSAALRSSPYDLGVSCYTPSVSKISVRNALYLGSGTPPTTEFFCKINGDFQDIGEYPEASNGQCWHDLFRNPVVAKGYPILRRTKPCMGLEIPLNMMAKLGGTQRANVFYGNLFIKGFSTMLIPTKQSEDLLVWHFLFNKDRKRISYLDVTIPRAENVSVSILGKARHVIGWCSEIKNYAGRSHI